MDIHKGKHRSKSGWFELCYDVVSCKIAFEYYQKLGFELVGGNIDKGHIVISDGSVRLSLFEEEAIKSEFGLPFLINYRSADIYKTYEDLKAKGVEFIQEAKLFQDGVSIDAKTLDPDGNMIYFDTHPSEKENP